VSGFLPKKDAEAAGRLLAPGMLVEVVVGAGGLRPAGGASSVTVTCKPEAVAAAAAKEWDGLNIGGWLWGDSVICWACAACCAVSALLLCVCLQQPR